MAEEFLLEREEQIVTAVERVGLHRPGVGAEQIRQRCRAKPMPVQPPPAARREQPVKHEDAQHFFPIRILAEGRQARLEKIIQVQRAPELVPELPSLGRRAFRAKDPLSFCSAISACQLQNLGSFAPPASPKKSFFSSSCGSRVNTLQLGMGFAGALQNTAVSERE
ncbi:MAG: hypothetical protein HY302_05280 [Opitutae bacterium]|nr:hypothetical protein [Opitutae bacterium]